MKQRWCWCRRPAVTEWLESDLAPKWSCARHYPEPDASFAIVIVLALRALRARRTHRRYIWTARPIQAWSANQLESALGEARNAYESAKRVMAGVKL